MRPPQTPLVFLINALLTLWIHTCGSIMAPQATVDLTYSATDLLQLNSSSRRLPTEVYKLCTSLGIARRPRFLHRGGRRIIHSNIIIVPKSFLAL